uniref:Uncharacterized protein n=1 Tax=Arundo donax TaxID=35708 RepID=A0A0A9TZ62_ARUDO
MNPAPSSSKMVKEFSLSTPEMLIPQASDEKNKN